MGSVLSHHSLEVSHSLSYIITSFPVLHYAHLCRELGLIQFLLCKFGRGEIVPELCRGRHGVRAEHILKLFADLRDARDFRKRGRSPRWRDRSEGKSISQSIRILMIDAASRRRASSRWSFCICDCIPYFFRTYAPRVTFVAKSHCKLKPTSRLAVDAL